MINDIFKYLNIITFCLAWYKESSEDKVFDRDELEKAASALVLWFNVKLTPEQVSTLFDIIAQLKGEELEIKL